MESAVFPHANREVKRRAQGLDGALSLLPVLELGVLPKRSVGREQDRTDLDTAVVNTGRIRHRLRGSRCAQLGRTDVR